MAKETTKEVPTEEIVVEQPVMDEWGCIIKPIGEIITTEITNEDVSPLNEGE